MCSRYYRFKDLKDLILRFKIAQVLAVLDPQYNIAPTDMALVIPAADQERVGVAKRFGITNPFFNQNPGLLINMRAESFSEKAAFKPYLLNQRCLVVADGFIGWRRVDTGKKKTDNYPFRFDVKNHETVGLAGIYTEEGFVVITTAPNALVSTIHDRMPVILRKGDEEAWLDSNLKDFAKLITMLAPYPAADMEKAELPKAASNSRNKQADVLKPIAVRNAALD